MGKIKILVFILELCLIYSQCGSFATLKPTWPYKLVQFTVIFVCHHIWLHTGSDKGLIQTTRLSPNLFTYISVLALCECVFDEAEEPDKSLGGRTFPRSPEWQRNNAVTDQGHKCFSPHSSKLRQGDHWNNEAEQRETLCFFHLLSLNISVTYCTYTIIQTND